ncbi:glycosyltransferase family 8 protein [Paracoccus luteus]|uniref:glycosyltransferase family 8 protein n=1 Tax=Paracoccus luteus TaxID=2508543 RepID=UPI00106F9845|nr:glycosyltransferase family 8 protein [Paracoccus luteus]
MHIVTGSDDNYAAGVLVLIASAAFHTPDARFTVLDMGISAENRARIDALGDRLGGRVSRIEISEERFADVPVMRRHLTRSTYLRLLIPVLMPEAERVVYMDCDMVVIDDLSELDRVPLGNAPVAAVPCPSPDAAELADTGIAAATYVNAGLLVMNLPVWRAEDIAGQCLALLSDPARRLLAEDQSAINLVCRGRILPLPARFNVYADPAAYALTGALPDNPAVLHFVVNNKPWTLPGALAAVWQMHADRIADLMPPRKRVTWRQRLSRLNRSRRLALGVLARRPKYLGRVRVQREMRDRIEAPYLARHSVAAR